MTHTMYNIEVLPINCFFGCVFHSDSHISIIYKHVFHYCKHDDIHCIHTIHTRLRIGTEYTVRFCVFGPMQMSTGYATQRSRSLSLLPVGSWSALGTCFSSWPFWIYVDMALSEKNQYQEWHFFNGEVDDQPEVCTLISAKRVDLMKVNNPIFDKTICVLRDLFHHKLKQLRCKTRPLSMTVPQVHHLTACQYLKTHITSLLPPWWLRRKLSASCLC
jgi:hypothetical protein